MTRRRAVRERRANNAFLRWWKHRYEDVPDYVRLTRTEWRRAVWAAKQKIRNVLDPSAPN